jgi:shikimate dehydrogenase
MGAVNCVHRVGRELTGENTDGKGFVQSLRALVDPADKNVVVLGAGGAARAIAVEVGLSGTANIIVVNRDETRGRELVQLINDRVHVPSQFVKWEGN